MENAELIVMGILGVIVLVVFAYVSNRQMATLTAFIAPFVGVMNTLIQRADVALVPYGAQLRPVNDLAGAVTTLVDQDTDALVQVLPDEVIAALRVLLGHVGKLTNGVADAAAGEDTPPQEHLEGPLETGR